MHAQAPSSDLIQPWARDNAEVEADKVGDAQSLVHDTATGTRHS